MATPYVVPKIPLAKTSNEFDDNNTITGCTASVASNSCRYSCNSWCPMCESKADHDSLTKTLVEGLRKVDTGLQTLHPVINKLNTQTISDNLSQKLSNISQKANILLSPAKDIKNDNGSPLKSENGVHEKYVREVEALKGKIQELRENLNRQFNDSESLITSIPKLLWNKDSDKATVKNQDEENNVPDNSHTAEVLKRAKRLSESENCSSLGAVVAQKRPRDISPVENIICDKQVSSVNDSKFVSNSRLNKSKSPVKFKDQNFSIGISNVGKSVGVISEYPSPVSPDTSLSNVFSSSKEPFKCYAVEQRQSFSPAADKTVLQTPPLDKGSSLKPPVPKSVNSVPLIDDCTKQISVENNLVKSRKVVEARSSLHPALRPSLFSNVPPFIKFVSHDTEVKDALPASVSKVLRWKITTITPLVVRKTVLNSGFKLVKQSPEWTGTWGKHMKSVMFRTIREHQKINHFPGTFQIGRKDKLWKNLSHLMTVFSKVEFGFIPRTYILPQDTKYLRLAWERDGGGDSTWIVKPPASARGTGIKVVNKWNQIPKKSPMIVQKYISNPFLINGNKFDLRLYALVTSFNPLRIYLYDNGLVRFASVKYSEDLNNLSDRYMHLTNYSINKLSNNYHHNEDADACQGHKWTIKTLFTYLQDRVDVKALWDRLVDLVIKTTLCGESSICQLSKSNLTSHYCSYELFGVDVLLDENLTPWLLEVNISPSLHSASPLDLAVKGPLITDILNIAGYQIPDKLTPTAKSEMKAKLGLPEQEPLCFNKDLYIAGLSTLEREKQKLFIDIDRPEYLDSILNCLSPDDIRHLIRYEDELTQIGSFKKVFPTTESHEYLKYFESPQYYNKLFDAWETKYGSDRNQGIRHLQDLCRKGYHLDVEDNTLHVSPCVSEILETQSESQTLLTESSEASILQERTNAAVLTAVRRRKKVNFTGRPYSRFNKPRQRRIATRQT